MRCTLVAVAFVALLSVALCEDGGDGDIDDAGNIATCMDHTNANACGNDEACKWDGDACQDDFSGGPTGGPPLGETTTRATGAGGPDDGRDCASVEDKNECSSTAGCSWEDLEAICAGDGGNNDPGGGGTATGDCTEVFEEAKCGVTAGCEWDGGTSQCERAGDPSDGISYQCVEVDIQQSTCEKEEDEASCGGADGCEWLGTTCGKDFTYDPNDCAQLSSAEKCATKEWGSANMAEGTVSPGCDWDDIQGNCIAPVDDSSTGEGTQGQDGNVENCAEITDEDICKQQTTDAEGDAEQGEQRCNWAEVEVLNDDGEGGADCFAVDNRKSCNELKVDGNKACEWEDEQGDDANEVGDDPLPGGGTGSDDGGDGPPTGSSESGMCTPYDFCSELKAEDECMEGGSCQWQGDECTGFGGDEGGGGGGLINGCLTMGSQKTCDAYSPFGQPVGGGEGEGELGPGTGGNMSDDPACLWVKQTKTECQAVDACNDKHSSESSCNSDKACLWEEEEGKCYVDGGTDGGGAEGGAMLCMATNADDCKTIGADKCRWFEGDVESCIDFQECALFTVDLCESLTDEEKCYWDDFEGCQKGDKPTTVTTSTSTTTTTSDTSTTSTFHCTPTKAGEERVLCKSMDECVRLSFVCDGGAPDCDDGSDEDECSTTTTTTPPFACDYDEMMCGSGDQCVRKRYGCDGEPDCDDKSDEKGCEETTQRTERSTTKTTTTTTRTTRTITTTKTQTTTTEDKCIGEGDCADGFEFADALKNSPLYSTPVKCRMCARKMSKAAVCAEQKTVGCIAETAEEEDTIAQRANAAEIRFLRVNLEGKVRAADFIVSFEPFISQIPSQNNGTIAVRISDIVDVDLEIVGGSEYEKIAIWTTKTSGAATEIQYAAASFPVMVGNVEITVYNGRLMDVDARSGPTLRVPDTGTGTDTGSDTTNDGSSTGVVAPGDADDDFERDTTDIATGGMGNNVGPNPDTDDEPFVSGKFDTLFVPAMASMRDGKYYFEGQMIDTATDAQILETAGYMNLAVGDSLSAEDVRGLVRQENAARMAAAESSAADRGDDPDAANTGGGAGKIVLVVVLVLVALGSVGGIYFVTARRNAGAPRQRMNGPGMGNSSAIYANGAMDLGAMPMGAPTAGVPSWADPAVPFLSRAEAEAQLQQAGFANGSFVIRQSTSNAKGYVITSCNSGKIQHIQLKRQSDGCLYYGPKSCGLNIANAISALQNVVPVAPKDGPQYFLKHSVSETMNSDA